MNQKKFKIVVKTLAGLEELLADEVKQLGGTNIEVMRRSISYKGDTRLLYASNYVLRTALRILKPIQEFTFFDAEDLYERLLKVNWLDYMDEKDTFAIDETVYSPHFTNTRYAVFKFKDAICDYFIKKRHRRPSINTLYPRVRFNLYIVNNRCIVSLDSSGNSLHKRNYRFHEWEAPLNEVLAAGMIKLSGWNMKEPFYDPMCGSGTLLIEAAMLAKNIPAGYYREEFGFTSWQDFDQPLWEEIKAEFDKKIVPLNCQISGSDIESEAIRAARVNIRRIKLQKEIKVQQVDFTTDENKLESGMLLTNPPYGERIEADIEQLYGAIGSRLKHDFPGFTCWILSAPPSNFKYLGLRPAKKITLFNGQLECKFQKYELYTGSKKKVVD